MRPYDAQYTTQFFVLTMGRGSHYENEAYMVSQRGGDLELILGQDISVGHEKHAQTSVTLYITESFTFRILEPAAVIHYTAR